MSIYEFLHVIALLCTPVAAPGPCVDAFTKCAEPHYINFTARYHPNVRKCFIRK